MLDIFFQVMTWILRSAIVIGLIIGIVLIGMMLVAELKDHDEY